MVDSGTRSKCKLSLGWGESESKIGQTRPENPDTYVRDNRNPENPVGDRKNRMRLVELAREAAKR